MNRCFLGNLLLAFGILILFGCGKNNQLSKTEGIPTLVIPHSEASAKPAWLTDYSDETRAIPLESTPKSLISYIGDVAFGETYIYVLNLGADPSIMQFDWDGRYIRRIGINGQGPGEFQVPTSIAYDGRRKRLIVCAPFDHKTLIFEEDGTLVEEYIDKTRMLSATFVTSDHYFFWESQYGEPHENGFLVNNRLHVLGSEFDTLASPAHNIHLIRNLGLVYRQQNFVFQVNDTSYFFLPTLLPETYRRDTLYTVSNNFELVPEVNFRFRESVSEATFPPEFSMGDVQVTPTLYQVQYRYKGERYLYIHEKSNRKSSVVKGGFQDPKFPETGMPFSKSNGTSYFVIEQRDAVGQEDNPMLLWVRWK
ncbi:MAG: 6-bladed beta-propeller [Lunatimonas sp.]|uniref:6-bladed beta-propeller n=1 Tax=Lunatimonas sp. TaxID=2060141 RepID=UPI00263B7420|nr:6-bladed beta-propeller [Lunatimonas sp.]MCC5938476.1 6-bladed beta-propeller [Lunatimonas sp.]